ncbi:cholesterol esterase [Entomophthora muscae]|uniref:Cholesterol esterase n=1 Tax=Entomophthora muscae TaxID=34485 RepID=A0ACC2TN63_9FUNG|nr:cholesterol esterase [Entomophthora muscae]
MPQIPILGRLALWDYISLALTFALFLTEKAARIVLTFIPSSWLKASDSPSNKVEICGSAEELVKKWGYPYQEYVVSTEDGYFLGIQRIPSTGSTLDPSEGMLIKSDNTGTGTPPLPSPASAEQSKPVVLLWHGFLMNSEVFLSKPDRIDNLAFMLVEQGYDVWLGNTRGNKYSLKHRTLSPANDDFWDFSLDEFARHDLPATVDFILKATGVSSLTYIGFSQGTAQCFAALSTHAYLNKAINLFICLAPALAPKGLENHTVNAIMGASPNLVYLMFGRGCAIAATLFWQSVLPSKLFVRLIDDSMHFLFRWKTWSMSERTKASCYFHLYSMTSVKCVVHWFQIIRAGRFQFYDDISPSVFNPIPAHIALGYPTRQITCPIAVFYGGSDTLTEITRLFSLLPQPVYSKEVSHYEHLDFLWADDIHREVYNHLVPLLSKFNPGAISSC